MSKKILNVNDEIQLKYDLELSDGIRKKGTKGVCYETRTPHYGWIRLEDGKEVMLMDEFFEIIEK